MVILRNYRIANIEGKNYILTKERHPCPTCNGVLRPMRRIERQVIDACGETEIYYLRRLRCRDCGASHLALPDFISTHKRYAKAVIDQAVRDDLPFCSAETCTILRWSREWKESTAEISK